MKRGKKKVIIFLVIIIILAAAIYGWLKVKQALKGQTNNTPSATFSCPDDPKFKNSIGVIISPEQRAKNEKTLAELNKQSDSAEKYFNLGFFYRASDQLDKACAAFLKSISLNDGLFLTYSALGTVYEERGDIEQAVRALLKAIEKSPQDPVAYDKLAIIYRQNNLKSVDEINKFYEQAIITTRGDVNLALQYAAYLEEQKNYPKAIEMLKAVLERQGGKNKLVEEKIKTLEKK